MKGMYGVKVLFYYRGRESLGVEYLSAVLKQAGHTVRLIFDPGLDNNFYWKNDLLRRLHMEEEMFGLAEEFQPDLLAFSSTTNEYPFVLKVAAELKKRLPVPVIVGGIHPTSVPEFVISNPLVDMICIGEGESAILELLDRMSNQRDYGDVRNIWVKKPNGDVERNELRNLIEDLDSLPFPDKDIFYQFGVFKGLMQVMTGRGCPFSCSYCHNNVCRRMYRGRGKYVRRRSPGNVIKELKLYKEKYPVTGVSFQDDLFLMDREWIEEFYSMYVTEVNLPFSCNAFPTRMDEKVVSMLKEMGCRNLFVGIDSGNEELRNSVLNRKTPIDEIKKNMAIVRKYGIPIELSAVFCFPGETPEQMWETIDLVDELGPSAVQSHILFPFPGTDVYRKCIKTGMIDEETVELIKRGEGSIVGESLLKHPYKDLAYVLAKLMAVYVKLPKFLKPLFRRLMTEKAKPVANAVFLLTIPFLFPWQGMERIRELILMVLKSRKYYSHQRSTGISGGS